MKTPYLRAVEWIALNDAPGDDDALDVDAVAGLISVVLVADVWDRDPRLVARQVIAVRNYCKEQGK